MLKCPHVFVHQVHPVFQFSDIFSCSDPQVNTCAYRPRGLSTLLGLVEVGSHLWATLGSTPHGMGASVWDTVATGFWAHERVPQRSPILVSPSEGCVGPFGGTFFQYLKHVQEGNHI